MDYTCVGGTTTTPSLCSFSGTITIDVIKTTKDPLANKVYLEALLVPALSELGLIDFNMVFIPNFEV